MPSLQIRLGSVLALIFAFATTVSWAQAPPPAKRVAILIGVDQFSDPATSNDYKPLKYASSGVLSVAGRLQTSPEPEGKKNGFDWVITLTTNADPKPTKAEIEKGLKDVLGKINNYDTLLFMFVGHGQRIGDTNYLLPADAGPMEKGAAGSAGPGVPAVAPGSAAPANAYRPGKNWISDTWLLDQFKDNALSGLQKIFVFDACRAADANLIATRATGLPANTYMLFSCQPNESSAQSDTLKNGLFTQALVEALDGGTDQKTIYSFLDVIINVARSIEYTGVRVDFFASDINSRRQPAQAEIRQHPQIESNANVQSVLGEYGRFHLRPQPGQTELTKEAFEANKTALWPSLFVKDPIKKGTSLAEYTLIGAQMKGVSAEDVDFTGADLTKADFTNAKLVKSKFIRCRLAFANFTNADLSGVDFTGALGIETAVFTGAKTDGNTKGVPKK